MHLSGLRPDPKRRTAATSTRSLPLGFERPLREGQKRGWPQIAVIEPGPGASQGLGIPLDALNRDTAGVFRCRSRPKPHDGLSHQAVRSRQWLQWHKRCAASPISSAAFPAASQVRCPGCCGLVHRPYPKRMRADQGSECISQCWRADQISYRLRLQLEENSVVGQSKCCSVVPTHPSLLFSQSPESSVRSNINQEGDHLPTGPWHHKFALDHAMDRACQSSVLFPRNLNANGWRN